MGIDFNKLIENDNDKNNIDNSYKTEIDDVIEYEEILLCISNSIKKYRKDFNLTQKQLAEKLDMNQVMISKLESGNYNPTFKLLHNISKKLTDSADLFVNTLENINDSIKGIYNYNYNFKVEDSAYSYDNKHEGRIISASIEMFKGGIYNVKECTSRIAAN